MKIFKNITNKNLKLDTKVPKGTNLYADFSPVLKFYPNGLLGPMKSC